MASMGGQVSGMLEDLCSCSIQAFISISLIKHVEMDWRMSAAAGAGGPGRLDPGPETRRVS